MTLPVGEVARLGAVANGWEPPPAAGKADVTEGLYCGNFRFGTVSIANCEFRVCQKSQIGTPPSQGTTYLVTPSRLPARSVLLLRRGLHRRGRLPAGDPHPKGNVINTIMLAYKLN
ncbi:MAG: hypothetical protein IIY78_03215, partial [Clostridia bacterium]|nr:hypothetical protein [Clostridia bacterium]